MKDPLPLLAEYLEGLPRGLDSYPEHTQKASVYRQACGRRYASKLAPLLPATLARLLTEPAPISAWIPEVHGNALFVALYETSYGEEESFLRDGRETGRKLFNGPLYKMLMALASPALIVRRANAGWTALHRGIALDARLTGNQAASIRVTFPHNLVPRVGALTYASAFHAALEAAGGKRVACALTSLAAEHAQYDATWTQP
jgi:hypothetical protein